MRRGWGGAMELKEYFLGLLAIITGLAITDMILSVHGLLRRVSRVRWDWLPLTAAALVFVVIVRSWWIAWEPDWINTPMWQFLLILIQLTCLFLAAKSVLPDDSDAEEVDLMAHYWSQNRFVWASLIGMITAFAAASVFLRINDPASLSAWFWTFGWELPVYCLPLVVLILLQRPIVHRALVPALLLAWLVLNGTDVMHYS
ncbi:hypothetical protein CC_0818 [Caulobacter vibrioides CB15]|uniref:Uncharacterized protein n=2 Tax=Caulobacter vibrioides TaxID=155892 RepID=Q9A9Z3_CAUVC|nr:hypothetical protein CC_0818 [Caulobacter vibrioides CB15]ATC27660.1 hypothetical protein CA607_04355 [Caulobacter vibrioides]